jgi:peptidoglycan/LPS O-acetylase OafA/YrhL
MKRFALLDPLRGVAALWVFAFHLQRADSWTPLLGPFIRLFTLGHLGVPMFFVLSGYCITAAGQTAATQTSVWPFLYRRLRRIYPPYWGSIAIVVALPFLIEGLSALKTGHFIWPVSDDNINLRFMKYSLRDWVGVVTLLKIFEPDPTAGSLQHKFTTINAVYWTLAIEVQFYLVVALAVALRSRFFAALVSITAICATTAFIGYMYLTGFFAPYWPMFAAGVAVYWLLERGVTPSTLFGHHDKLAALAAIVALSLAFLVVAVIGVDITTTIFAVGFATVIFALSVFDARFAALSTHRRAIIRLPVQAAIQLGLMSYTIYLLHGRLQFLAHQIVRQVSTTHSILQDCSVVTVTLLLCYPFYVFIERPFTRTRRRVTVDLATPYDRTTNHHRHSA